MGEEKYIVFYADYKLKLNCFIYNRKGNAYMCEFPGYDLKSWQS